MREKASLGIRNPGTCLASAQEHIAIYLDTQGNLTLYECIDERVIVTVLPSPRSPSPHKRKQASRRENLTPSGCREVDKHKWGATNLLAYMVC